MLQTAPRRAVQWGMQIDLGVPDGLMAGVTFKPPMPVRLNAALGYNTVSPGLRLGIEWMPLGHTWLLSAQGGHFFQGDASHWASKPNSADGILLERVSYNYFSWRAGAQWQSGPITYFGLLGLTYLRAPIEQVERLLAPIETGNGGTLIQVPDTPTLSVLMPTLQLGIVISP